ncbi:acyl carrier protein [Spongiivirga citrea]|uniref:Acyl carrier protein n=1 Tax=Spongiivirga citrea TaxID=1481457 RepID=A0A6M0CSS0_9FLAO|nr:acyl carrier protein [Spongiivirga citrea]NER16880.1 acyl carrier protein [Spongiivirga citrea]
MDKEQLLLKITEAFSKVLEHNNFELQNETTANDVDGWDSVTHMMIINEIENLFSIKFQLMDLMNMQNVGDLVAVLEKELASKA